MSTKVKNDNIGKKEDNTGKKEALIWNPQMDYAFIHAMRKEQDKGNMIDGAFTSQAYKNMVDELSKNLKIDFNKNHLKNRLKTIKQHFAQYYDVFRGASLSGFSWNPETKLLEAEDEVWEELIANKPEAAKWKTKPILNYNELYELFAKDRATGAAAETAKERKKRVNNDVENIQTFDELDQLVSNNEISLENINNDDDIQVISSPLYSRKKPQNIKRKRADEQSEFAYTIIGSIEKVADAMKECTKAIVGSHQHVYSGDEIFNELELMGVSEDVIHEAYLFLVRSPENQHALFSCPPSRRTTILKKMMGIHD